MDATTTEELRSLINGSDEFDFRFACGYTKPTQRMNLLDSNEMVRSVWLHHVLYSPHAELEQLRKGFLQTLRMQVLVSLHDDGVRALLAYSTLFDVTLEYLQDSFVFDYSPNGSNNRTKEEAIVIHWLEYVSNCKGIC